MLYASFDARNSKIIADLSYPLIRPGIRNSFHAWKLVHEIQNGRFLSVKLLVMHTSQAREIPTGLNPFRQVEPSLKLATSMDIDAPIAFVVILRWGDPIHRLKYQGRCHNGHVSLKDICMQSD